MINKIKKWNWALCLTIFVISMLGCLTNENFVGIYEVFTIVCIIFSILFAWIFK